MVNNQAISTGADALDGTMRTNHIGTTPTFFSSRLTGIFTPDFDPELFGKNVRRFSEQKYLSLTQQCQTSEKKLGKNVPKRELGGNYRSTSPLTPLNNVELATGDAQGDFANE